MQLRAQDSFRMGTPRFCCGHFLLSYGRRQDFQGLGWKPGVENCKSRPENGWDAVSHLMRRVTLWPGRVNDWSRGKIQLEASSAHIFTSTPSEHKVLRSAEFPGSTKFLLRSISIETWYLISKTDCSTWSPNITTVWRRLFLVLWSSQTGHLYPRVYQLYSSALREVLSNSWLSSLPPEKTVLLAWNLSMPRSGTLSLMVFFLLADG